MENRTGHDHADPSDPPPVRPVEPDAEDCCGEGCVRCVYDVHDEALERYRARLAAWQARHPGQPAEDDEAAQPPAAATKPKEDGGA